MKLKNMEIEVTKLDIKDGDIILLKYNDDRYNVNEVLEAVQKAHKGPNFPNATILILGNGYNLENVTERKMNRAGWYRKEERPE